MLTLHFALDRILILSVSIPTPRILPSNMGNLCGKEAADPFSQPGRTLDSAPPPASGTSSIPKHRSASGHRVSSGGSRTLGGRSNTEEARQAAARAAEVRPSPPPPPPPVASSLGMQLRDICH